MSKRVLAMALAILAFFIFVGSPFGQTAEAIAGVDDAIIAIIIAALAACGITFVTTGIFQSSQEYVGSLMQDYATANNTSVSSQLRGVQTGTNRLGQIVMNNRFVAYLSGFIAFVKNVLGLSNNGTYHLADSGLSIANYVTYELPVTVHNYDNERYYVRVSANMAPVYIIWYVVNNQSFCFAYSEAQFVLTRQDAGYFDYSYNFNSMNTAQYPGMNYVYIAASNPQSLDKYGWRYTNDNFDVIMQNIYESEIEAGGVDIYAYTGVITAPDQDADYTEGDGAILDVGAIWGTDYSGVTEDVIPGEFGDSKEGEATITYVGEDEVTEQVEDTPSQSISADPDSYQARGLPDVFPFCIPFDIYAFFECLVAEPEAPAFTWRFYIPGICDEEIEIDLAAFDSAARILRTMELLMFIVGLAFVTRDKFLRG